ncbi:P450-derived glycosyltransferase activator [Streptomyces sp. NPDC088116]|uniref:P450-derived glycosyltransferase activator n=1 Tax=Streptomyces sp. NPDC088116 TaxID=3365825 RepID=UPI003811A889
MPTTTATAPAPPDDGTRELGRRLQLTRAGIWFAGNQGDPYALILRSADDHPAPYEERIRGHGPWFRSDLLDTWVTADPRIAEAVLADPRFGALDRAGRRPGAELLPVCDAFPEYERAELARLRASADPVLADPVLADPGLADPVLADAQPADPVHPFTVPAGAAGFDLVADAARPYVGALVARLLGVPDRDREEAARTLGRCAPQLDSRFTPQTLTVAQDSAAAVHTVAGLVRERVAAAARTARRSGPRPDDVPGLLLNHGVAPGDVERIALVLAIGTPEPATTVIANTVRRLLERPGQWAAVRRHPAAAAAVDRTLRDLPPARLESRVAHEDADLGGHHLSADDHVVVLATAGRDAPGTGPLGGPDGPHFALALPLVRLAATTAVQAMAEALPGLRTAGEVLMRPRSPVVRAYARFPVQA